MPLHFEIYKLSQGHLEGLGCELGIFGRPLRCTCRCRDRNACPEVLLFSLSSAACLFNRIP